MLKQRRFNTESTSWRRIKVESTLLRLGIDSTLNRHCFNNVCLMGIFEKHSRLTVFTLSLRTDISLQTADPEQTPQYTASECVYIIYQSFSSVLSTSKGSKMDLLHIWISIIRSQPSGHTMLEYPWFNVDSMSDETTLILRLFNVWRWIDVVQYCEPARIRSPYT